MRRLTGILLAVLTVLALLVPASASRHLEAKNVIWRGGPFLLNQDTGELVRLDTDTVLLNGVTDLQGDGESLWARTAENWFRVEGDGTLTPSGIQPLLDAWYEECVWGLLLSESSDSLRVYRLTDGIPLVDLPGYGTSDVRVYRDAETDEVFLLARNGLFLRSDGTPVAEGYVFKTGNLKPLALLNHFHEDGSLCQRVVRTGIQPGETAAQGLDLQFTIGQKGLVHGCNLKLATG